METWIINLLNSSFNYLRRNVQSSMFSVLLKAHKNTHRNYSALAGNSAYFNY